MREMTVADVKTCGCCPHAQVLLQARDGTTGVLLALDAAVARYLRGGERAMGGGGISIADGSSAQRLRGQRICPEAGGCRSDCGVCVGWQGLLGASPARGRIPLFPE
jgi:hypothetical protein